MCSHGQHCEAPGPLKSRHAEYPEVIFDKHYHRSSYYDIILTDWIAIFLAEYFSVDENQ